MSYIVPIIISCATQIYHICVHIYVQIGCQGPPGPLMLSCPVLALRHIAFTIGIRKWQAYYTRLSTFFHKNISHTTKLPHHHAQLPCTLCKPVVWGQSHGSRASSPVPSQRALNRNPAQNHNALPTAGLRPSKKMILVVCTSYFIVVECCCHMPHVAMHWTNQKFWSSYAQSMCANSGAFCFQSVLFGSLTITQHRSLFKLYTGWWPGWHVCPRETAWLRTG